MLVQEPKLAIGYNVSIGKLKGVVETITKDRVLIRLDNGRLLSVTFGEIENALGLR